MNETPDDIRKVLAEKLRFLNEFIRGIEDFGKQYSVDYTNDYIYLAALSQKKIIKEILNIKP